MSWLTSPLLPVPHGFSTRDGGVSEGPFASLNLGLSVGDAPERVHENLRRAAAFAKVDPSELHTVSQVHGDRVLEAPPPGPRSDQVPPPFGEADALWTARADGAVGVKTADCVPVLIADPVGRRVAAVHSGWRGTALEVAARAVEALARQGARPVDLKVAIGPSIRSCCYRVSADLFQRFREQFGPDVAIEEDGAYHLDLATAVRRTFERAGVPGAGIDLLPDCTSCDGRFFSHRRDQGRTGRHLSLVVCRF